MKKLKHNKRKGRKRAFKRGREYRQKRNVYATDGKEGKAADIYKSMQISKLSDMQNPRIFIYREEVWTELLEPPFRFFPVFWSKIMQIRTKIAIRSMNNSMACQI